MARYTNDLTVAVPLAQLYQQVTDVLKVLVDSTRATQETTTLTMVVKNEELPLQTQNHCYGIYQKVNKAIADNKGWNLIRSTPSSVVG
jgi:hypothetical protein